jgi:hypothetical protein
LTQSSDPRWINDFLFSPSYCGSQVTGYLPTGEYEGRVVGDNERLDFAEAVAISGAALSPGNVRNPLIAFLMLVLNMRLGQWLPNPMTSPPRWRPRALNLLWGLRKPAKQRSYCFVTDGGQSENLGLCQLMRRECKLIICVDAGHDPEHCFDDLARVIRMARIHGGIEVLELVDQFGQERDLDCTPLQLAKLAKDDDPATPRNTRTSFLVGRIRYGTKLEMHKAVLVYIKPCFVGGESVDLLQYRSRNPAFPHESTTDQLYDEDQVEAYRRLGCTIGAKICRTLPRGLWDRDDVSVDQIVEAIEELIREAELEAKLGDAAPPDDEAESMVPSLPK